MRTRAIRLLALMLLLALLLVGGSLAIGRAQPVLAQSRYMCLIFDGDGLHNGQILDVRNGNYHRDWRTRMAPNAVSMPGDLSPDQRYRAYLSWNGYPDGTNTLFLYPAAGGEIKVQDDITSPFYFFWSPDGKQLAYTYANQQEVILSVANADGTNLRHVQLSTVSPLDTFMRGWSPDGRYLLLGTSQSDGRRWEFWDADTLTPHTLNAWDWIDRAEWSPDGSYLYYLSSRNSTPNTTMNVVKMANFTQHGYILAGAASIFNIRWSPSSQYIKINYSTSSPALTWHLDVIGVDGREYRVLADAEVPDTIALDQIAQFTEQTSQLVYFRQVGGYERGHLSLNRYTPTTGENIVLIPDLPKPLFPSPSQPERIAALERDGAQITGVVMNLDGSQRTPLFQTDGDYGDGAWSPDGKYIAFTWSSGRGDQRDVHLSWSQADGTGLQDLHGFIDIRDLVFSGDTAMFLAKLSGQSNFNVHRLDLVTGKRTYVGKPVDEVMYTDTDPDTGDYRVWWRVYGSNLGVDIYTIDTAHALERHFRFGLYQIAIKNPPGFFLAPGGKVAATKFGTYGLHEYMQVSRADDSYPRVIARDVAGLGDALWSPDGKLIAFTQALVDFVPGQPYPKPHITLEVYTADGNFIRSVDGRSGMYRNLAWTTCE